MHKTGTSAIQSYLAANYNNLLERGVLYPTTERDQFKDSSHVGHHRLAWATIKRYSLKYDTQISEDPWICLKSEINNKNPDSIILSSEFFWPAGINEVLKIKNYLAEFSVQIIIYFRNSLSMAISSYKQDIKTGKFFEGFREHCRQQLWMHDYHSILKRWADTFGKENVHIKIYDKLKNNLIENFAQEVSADDNLIPSGQFNKNTSPSDGVIMLLRFINSIESKIPKGKSTLLQRIRRNILMDRRPGNYINMFMDNNFKLKVVQESDIEWLRLKTHNMKEEFLEEWIPPNDQYLFEF